MKTLIKTTMTPITTLRALASVIAATIALGLSSAAVAGGEAQVCGPQTLQGSYVFTAHGFTIVSGVAQPKAIVEGIDFNGDGTLSVPFGTLSVNGIIIQIPPGGVGTYTLDSSCEGTLTFSSGPVNYNISVGHNANEIFMIQSDANTVFQGEAKKVAR